MARFVSPITDMKPNGSLRFFKSGTNTPLITYKDELQTIPNPTIVPVLVNGNVQNVFYSGSAKVIYLDEFDQQYAERDPVGGEKELGDFSLWDQTVIYDSNDIVEGSDGNFYRSISDGNQANDPISTPTRWELISFLGLWNVNILYSTGSVVKTSTGNLWKSVASNSGNDPEADGGTNWIPAIDGEKVAQITSNAEKITNLTTVIPQVGGGALTANRENEIRDAGTYTLPLANSVLVNETIVISLPDEYSSNEPLVQRSGSDTISYSGGTDTEILLNQKSSVKITLTSDGASDWSL